MQLDLFDVTDEGLMASNVVQPAKITAMKSSLILFVLIGFLGLFASPVQGQHRDNTSEEHNVALSNWPLSAYDKAVTDSLFFSSEIVPQIDALTLGYTYGIEDELPAFKYTVQWAPGDFIYLDGKKSAFNELPGEVMIESIVLQSEVVVDGRPVTLLTLAHDSLMSSAAPGFVSVELGSLTWSTFFADTDASTARSYFEEGFQLANLKISEISFVYFEDDGVIAENEPRVRRPSRRTIYRPGISIWIDFPFYGRRPPPRIAGVDTRSTAPRGDRVNRGDGDGDERRTSRRGGSDRTAENSTAGNDRAEDDEANEGILSRRKKKKSDDDDEEDEGDLLPAAIAGVAAVAAVAVIGGTVGYYGNAEHAPIGLMTGYVNSKGGVLLQAAVNQAVLEKSKSDTEHLVGRIAGFYDFFNSPVQPALAVGVLVSQENNNVDYEPSLSFGLAGNFGSFVLLGGYDVLNTGLDFGIAYNFRARR